MSIRKTKTPKIHKGLRAFSLSPIFVFILLAITPTPNHDRKWLKQQPGVVESWTPRTRTRTGGKEILIRHHQPQHRRLAMFPSSYLDEIGSPPSTTTAETTIPKQQKPLEHRIAAILEFVDTTVLDSSSSRKEIESILERVHIQHRDDFDTAKSSNLEVEELDSGIPRSPFSFERIARNPPSSLGRPPLFDATKHDSHPTLAIRSMEPVIDASSVDAVTKAAEDVWMAEKGGDASSSRFTYQYSGNSEAHVFDFITTNADADTKPNANGTATLDMDSAGKRAISALNEALQRTIYPTIREAFFQTSSYNGSIKSNQREDDDGIRLFVYDALVIRYNSTEAAEAAEASGGGAIPSAGQPLHRDLGLVSVNIMLNSAENFEGGGTFFENQLLLEAADESKSTTTTTKTIQIQPLKPSGIGHCLAHSASERHAGAGTTTGVRDILVLFVSAATRVGRGSSSSSRKTIIEAPAELLSARLRSCRDFCEQTARLNGGVTIESEQQFMQARRSALLCRILHQRLAVTAGSKGTVTPSSSLLSQQPYCDGEALQYLGTALMEYASSCLVVSDDPREAIGVLEVASECFGVASLVTPCDSRVYNNLGIVLGTINEMEQNYYHGFDREPNNEGTSAASSVVGGATARARREMDQETAYRKGLDILQRSIRAGCTNESLTRDMESLALNYGLFVANQDRFRDAAAILEPAVSAAVASRDGGGVETDADRLWKYCKHRCLEEQ